MQRPLPDGWHIAVHRHQPGVNMVLGGLPDIRVPGTVQEGPAYPRGHLSANVRPGDGTVLAAVWAEERRDSRWPGHWRAHWAASQERDDRGTATGEDLGWCLRVLGVPEKVAQEIARELEDPVSLTHLLEVLES